MRLEPIAHPSLARRLGYPAAALGLTVVIASLLLVLTHSDMDRMFVVTQYNSISLHRHIAWTYRFDAFSNGFVQILAAQQTFEGEYWFQGTADAVRRNMPVVEAGEFEITIGDQTGAFIVR